MRESAKYTRPEFRGIMFGCCDVYGVCIVNSWLTIGGLKMGQNAGCPHTKTTLFLGLRFPEYPWMYVYHVVATLLTDKFGNVGELVCLSIHPSSQCPAERLFLAWSPLLFCGGLNN